MKPMSIHRAHLRRPPAVTGGTVARANSCSRGHGAVAAPSRPVSLSLALSARRHSIRFRTLPRRRPPCRTRSPGPGVPEAASAVSRGGTGWHTKGGEIEAPWGWHGPWLSGHGPRTQTCRKPHGHLPMRLLLRAGRRHGRARLAPLRAARGSAADGRRRLRRGRGRVRHSMAAQPSAGLTPQPWLRRFAPRTGTPMWMRRQLRRLAPTAPAIGAERVRDRPDPVASLQTAGSASSS